jgi:hypothetical protein
MAKGIYRFGRYGMAFLAVGVALYSLRFWLVPAGIWLGIDDGIRGVIDRVPVQALIHMMVGPIALATGPFQFWGELRARAPRFHRWSGRVYAASVLIAGCAALATAPFASGGPIAGLGFGLLAICWIWTTSMGWWTARKRQFSRHRIWMRFSYAMTFGAVTLRLQIPFGFILFGYHSYRAMTPWLAYTSWIPNVVVVALYSIVNQKRRASPATVSERPA